MKRYLLFCGDKYYPYGGWDDFRGAFDTLEEAREAAVPTRTIYGDPSHDWWHIVDTETMQEVQ